MNKYSIPASWAQYSFIAVISEMTEARAMVMMLKHIPCQRMWLEKRFKSLINDEISALIALSGLETPGEKSSSSNDVTVRLSDIFLWLHNHYKSIEISGTFIKELYNRIIAGKADDNTDRLRNDGENAETSKIVVPAPSGGIDCRDTFDVFSKALENAVKTRNPLIQAAIIHYHLVVIKPFPTDNILVARFLETLMLMKGGMEDAHIAGLSKYYLEHSIEYSSAVAQSYNNTHDLTPFISFCLSAYAKAGMSIVESRLEENRKALYRDVVTRCFGSVQPRRKKAIADRQVMILMYLLDHSPVDENDLYALLKGSYASLKNPELAFNRDVGTLLCLGAIEVATDSFGRTILSSRMDWPCEMDIDDYHRICDEYSLMSNNPLQI